MIKSIQIELRIAKKKIARRLLNYSGRKKFRGWSLVLVTGSSGDLAGNILNVPPQSSGEAKKGFKCDALILYKKVKIFELMKNIACQPFIAYRLIMFKWSHSSFPRTPNPRRDRP